MKRLSFLLRAVIVPALALVELRALIRPNDHAYASIGIVTLVCVLLADLASLARGRLQNGLVTLAALAFGLVLIEAFAELSLPKIVIASEGLWQRDATLGWRLARPGIFPVKKTIDGKLIYQVSYTIDDGRRRLTRSPQDGTPVRFFGDSFTFGEGLNDAETLPQAFADLTGANVLNDGFSGYSPAQVLRILELGLFDQDLRSARLLIMQTGSFHAARTACLPSWSLPAPRYDIVGGRPTFVGPCTSEFWRPFETSWKDLGLYRLFLEPLIGQAKRKDVEKYIAIVGAIADLAENKYHVPFVIIYSHSGQRVQRLTGASDDEIIARFRKTGALVIDGTVEGPPGELLSIPGDGHPSGLANKLLAAKILEVLRRERPGILPMPQVNADQGLQTP